jgi:hypothetical protein
MSLIPTLRRSIVIDSESPPRAACGENRAQFSISAWRRMNYERSNGRLQ